jgi:hypothetical protein
MGGRSWVFWTTRYGQYRLCPPPRICNRWALSLKQTSDAVEVHGEQAVCLATPVEPGLVQELWSVIR